MKISIRTVTDIYISDLKDVMAAKANIQVLYFISHENLVYKIQMHGKKHYIK